MKEKVKAPKHLTAATRRWFETISNEYALESHHYRLLQAAAESWDRCQQAREALVEHGLTFVDSKGLPRARPECRIERESKLLFEKMVRALGLDLASDEMPRPGVTTGRGRR